MKIRRGAHVTTTKATHTSPTTNLNLLPRRLSRALFSTTTPLPVAGPVGYTVRVLPHHPLLASDTELGLVTLA